MQSRNSEHGLLYLATCHNNGRTLATTLLFFLNEDPVTMQMEQRGVSKSTTDFSQRLKNKCSSLCRLSESTEICFQFLLLKHAGLTSRSRADHNISAAL